MYVWLSLLFPTLRCHVKLFIIKEVILKRTINGQLRATEHNNQTRAHPPTRTKYLMIIHSLVMTVDVVACSTACLAGDCDSFLSY